MTKSSPGVEIRSSRRVEKSEIKQLFEDDGGRYALLITKVDDGKDTRMQRASNEANSGRDI